MPPLFSNKGGKNQYVCKYQPGTHLKVLSRDDKPLEHAGMTNLERYRIYIQGLALTWGFELTRATYHYELHPEDSSSDNNPVVFPVEHHFLGFLHEFMEFEALRNIEHFLSNHPAEFHSEN